MPGPRNQKKHRAEAKKAKKKEKGAAKALVPATLAYAEVIDVPPVAPETSGSTSVLDASYVALSLETAYVGTVCPNGLSNATENLMRCKPSPSVSTSPSAPVPSPPALNEEAFPTPCIEDPGSGPRVRDAVAFLASPWAIRPATRDEAPLCAELAEEEVLSMIREILPEQLAVVRALSLSGPGALTERPGRWYGITVLDDPVEYAQHVSVCTRLAIISQTLSPQKSLKMASTLA
jgi:hypothetical protein